MWQTLLIAVLLVAAYHMTHSLFQTATRRKLTPQIMHKSKLLQDKIDQNRTRLVDEDYDRMRRDVDQYFEELIPLIL